MQCFRIPFKPYCSKMAKRDTYSNTTGTPRDGALRLSGLLLLAELAPGVTNLELEAGSFPQSLGGPKLSADFLGCATLGGGVKV